MKKFLPYILILTVLAGIFGLATDVNAQVDPTARGTCTYQTTVLYIAKTENIPNTLFSECKAISNNTGTWKNNDGSAPVSVNTLSYRGSPDENKSALERAIGQCGVSNMNGCVLQIVYIFFGTLPAFLLSVAASFLNIIIALTISSALYTKAVFIGDAWVIVRDLSNIFFILILIYVAVKTILGLAGHDVKKMVVQVIIMALLINFSMFFTKIVIDASNILALIFYNKIAIETVVVDGLVAAKNGYIPALKPSTTGLQDKDITGALMSGFDPSRLLTDEFFEDKVKNKTQVTGLSFGATAGWAATGAILGSFIPVPILGTTIGYGGGAAAGYLVSKVVGWFVVSDTIPFPIMFGIVVITGLIMYFAFWTFIVAGFSFLGRMLELWVLIIFSPFAFMSSTIPILGHIEYIGWDAWLKRLFQVAFMAPIFMFFLYFILLMVNSNIFSSLTDRNFEEQGTLEAVVLVLIPAAVVLILLKKATDYAKKTSGVVGETLMKGAGILTGLAIGGGVGVAAAGLQGSLGHIGKRIFEDKGLAEAEAKGSGFAKTLRTLGGKAATSSFDARKGVVGGGLKLMSAATGFNLGSQSKFLLKEEGGYEADLKRRHEQRLKRAEGIKKAVGSEAIEHVHELEETHQGLLIDNSGAIEDKEREIKSAEAKRDRLRQDLQVTDKEDPDYQEKQAAAKAASQAVLDLYAEKGLIKNGMIIKVDPETGERSYNTHNGQISAKGVEALEEQEKITAAAAQANPTNTVLGNAAMVAKAMAAAARATKAFTEAEKTAAKLAKNPDDAEAIKKHREAELEREKTSKEADEATRGIETLASTDANYEDAAKAIRKMTDSAEMGLGNSINDYEDTIIPHAKHELKTVEEESAQAYADLIEHQFAWPWNEAARKKSAHDIRMGVKVESHGKSGGHGGIGEELISAFAAEALIGGHGHAPAKESGGGGGNAASPKH